MIKILGVSGSLRSGSHNTGLLQAAEALVPAGVMLQRFDALGDLPLFNPDVDERGAPAPVLVWRAALQAADAVIISTPEYAHGVPGALKNALDWVVASGEFVDKPTALVSVSTSGAGGEHSHAALLRTLIVMSARMGEGSTLQVGAVRAKLDAEGRLVEANTLAALRGILDALVADCVARA